MDKMFNILALMSVPLCWLVCRAWVRTLELRARGAWAGEQAQLHAQCRDLKERVETLETIVTAPSFPSPVTQPPLPPPPRPARPAPMALVPSTLHGTTG
jgi:hypothetical protein